MEKKTLMKIRLRADGKWEHVTYDEVSNKEFHQLYNKAQDYLDLAVEASGYRDAKEVIEYIKGLK
jgi:hypothetical protein